MGNEDLFIDWCHNNNIPFVKKNKEKFIISSNVVYSPKYIINYRIYVDVIDNYNDDFEKICEVFAQNHGQLILIPKDLLPELNKIIKNDIINKFNIRI